ncbi:hypothetical protein OS493_018444 [Desmophyllum pertusum]|uniref:Uronyl 2-sulfotransferase n=1 Tax=Desmophyllum pertusum TaxID=174260 RepID=A0A9X0A1J4_9CNID|nr:hypothetical protein OS493_018444 [Desmophyllum pertusum]
MPTTMQRLKFLLLLLIAFIASILYFVSHHLNVKSALIAGVTDVEERHYYNIHSWKDFTPVTQTVKAKRVIYNRVGKCGSRTVITLMNTLTRKNSFTVIGSTKNQLLHLNLQERVEYVDFLDHLRAPFIYHRHIHYVDFKRFGAVQPIYFNLIRDPLARLVSSYYYHRFGDFREGRKTWNFKGTAEEKNMTFDECVLNEVKECVDPEKLFYIVPYFCGHEAFCRKPSQLALRQAKINVITNYLVVGVTDEFEDFLSILEKLLPEFFKGVLELYKKPGDSLQNRMTTTKTMNKKGPSAEVEKIMKKHLELEYDFYYFVKDRFHRLKAELHT